MAEITQDSFDDTLALQKVVFQRGRDVLDSELNELQDDIRVAAYRASSAVGGDGVSSGFRVEATGSANEVRVTAGRAVIGGYSVTTPVTTVTGLTTPSGGTRTDRVYLRLREVEVDDPAPIGELGALSKRRQLEATLLVREGATYSSSGDLWSGGVRYYLLAVLTRPNSAATVLLAHIENVFRLLPSTAIDEITRNDDGVVARLRAGSEGVVEADEDLTLDVYPSETADDHLLKVRYGRDDGNPNTHTLSSNSILTLSSRSGDENPLQIQDSLMGSPAPFSDSSVTSEEDLAGRTLRDPLGDARGSLLRNLSARATLTVGDGSTTFGDYNGPTALVAAFDAADTLGLTSIQIQMKGGTYEVPSTLGSSGMEIALVRAGVGSVSIQATSASSPIFTANSFTASGITFSRGSGNTTTVAIQAAQITLDDCTLSSMGLKIYDAVFGSVVRRTLIVAGGGAVLRIEDQSGNIAVRVEQCDLRGAADYPIFSASDAGPTSLLVSASKITLGTNSSSATDSGVLAVDAAWVSGYTRVSFEDTDFIGASGSCYVQMGLQEYRNLYFTRCTFTMNGNNTSGAFLDLRARELVMRDCTITTNQYLCTAVSTEGAMVAIRASDRLLMENTYVRRTGTAGFVGTVASTGRLAVISAIVSRDAEIRGLSLDLALSTTTGTTPRQVLYIEGSGSPRCTVEGVSLLSNASQVIATQAVLRLVGVFRPAEVRGVRIAPFAVGQIPAGVSGILVGGTGTDSTKSGSGIRIRDCGLYSFSGTGIWDAHTDAGANVIDGCELSDVGSLTMSTVDYPILVGVPGTNVGNGGTTVQNCVVSSSPTVGINVCRNVASVQGCTVTNTSNDSSVTSGRHYQIYFAPYAAASFSAVISWRCHGNSCLSPSGTLWELGLSNGSPSGTLSRSVHQGFDTYDANTTEIFTVGTVTDDEPTIFNAANLRVI
jgi:hypothetical protein